MKMNWQTILKNYPATVCTPEVQALKDEINRISDNVQTLEVASKEAREAKNTNEYSRIRKAIKKLQTEQGELQRQLEPLKKDGIKYSASFILAQMYQVWEKAIGAYEAAKQEASDRCKDDPVYMISWYLPQLVKLQFESQLASRMKGYCDKHQCTFAQAMEYSKALRSEVMADLMSDIRDSYSTSPASNAISMALNSARKDVLRDRFYLSSVLPDANAWADEKMEADEDLNQLYG